MAYDEKYRQQVALLMRLLPLVGTESCFALKGGTAINLFVRDMPRLSVDIDLTYLPVEPREESLASIDAAMKRIAEMARRVSRDAQVDMVARSKGEECVTRLLVDTKDANVKIEVTPVLRGCVYNPEQRTVSPAVEDAFGFAEAKIVSFPDLYGGKIVAALDRQHPRDLYDVRDLLENEGINDELRRAFIVYLLSHDRPMSEVLAPKRKNITLDYKSGFQGMTEQPVPLSDLLDVRERLIAEIVGNMPEEHRRLLISVKRGKPDWSLLGLDGVEALPAVRWKLRNLEKLSADKRAALVARLEEVLG